MPPSLINIYSHDYKLAQCDVPFMFFIVWCVNVDLFPAIGVSLYLFEALYLLSWPQFFYSSII